MKNLSFMFFCGSHCICRILWRYYLFIVNVIKKVNVPDDIIVSLTLWDTPGTDDIDLTDIYFSHIDAAIGRLFLYFSVKY